MSAYRSVHLELYQPTSFAVAGAPAQGEWVNDAPMRIAEAWGLLTALSSELSASYLGQVGRQCYRWRGLLPDGVEPEPGWEVEIRGQRYRVVSVMNNCGRLWRLELDHLGAAER